MRRVLLDDFFTNFPFISNMYPIIALFAPHQELKFCYTDT